MHDTSPRVTACIPYYRGKRYIRRAVQSLLLQTCRDLQIIVVNDADRDEPWEALADIDDPRLIRFDLMRNHGGPYFAHAVVVEAVTSPWFLVQEQDDWSEPQRVAQLLRLASKSGADVAVSAQWSHRETANGTVTPAGVLWRYSGRAVCPHCGRGGRRCQRCFIDFSLTPQCLHRAPHAALFRMDVLRRVGGYYAGLRIHYDTLLMNFLLMVARVVHTPAALYNRVFRPESLTQARPTRIGSPVSAREHGILASLYGRAFRDYQRYRRGALTSAALAGSIRELRGAHVSESDRRELQAEAARLRERLRA